MPVYKGSCHCGAVQFEIDAHIHELTTCDCSLCVMRNAVMTRVNERQLTILTGENQLALYQWNTRIAKHYFCSRCGIYVFHRKRAMPDHFGVNVFCLRDFDHTAVPVRATEGKTMPVLEECALPQWPGPRVPT
jgi:hypothetical protein